MFRRSIFVLAFTVSLSLSATAQDQPKDQPQEQAQQPAKTPPVQEPDQVVRPIETAESVSTIRKILTNFAHDQKGIWTSPFHMSREDAPWWAAFGGGTVGLVAFDRRLSDALPDSASRVKFSKSFSRIGSDYITLPVAGGLYLYGRKFNDPKARETGVLGAETLLDSLILVEALKVAAGRERPDEGTGRFFKGHHGFPSGHAMMTWSFASLISHEYAPGKVVPIIAYSTATLVSVARFTARKHFAGDILAGGSMGWFIGRYVFNQHLDPNIHKRFNPPIAFTPVVNPITRSYGFSLALKR